MNNKIEKGILIILGLAMVLIIIFVLYKIAWDKGYQSAEDSICENLGYDRMTSSGRDEHDAFCVNGTDYPKIFFVREEDCIEFSHVGDYSYWNIHCAGELMDWWSWGSFETSFGKREDNFEYLKIKK